MAQPPVAGSTEKMSAACAINTATTILPTITAEARRVHTPNTIINAATTSANNAPYAINPGRPCASSMPAIPSIPPNNLWKPWKSIKPPTLSLTKTKPKSGFLQKSFSNFIIVSPIFKNLLLYVLLYPQQPLYPSYGINTECLSDDEFIAKINVFYETHKRLHAQNIVTKK